MHSIASLLSIILLMSVSICGYSQEFPTLSTQPSSDNYKMSAFGTYYWLQSFDSKNQVLRSRENKTHKLDSMIIWWNDNERLDWLVQAARIEYDYSDSLIIARSYSEGLYPSSYTKYYMTDDKVDSLTRHRDWGGYISFGRYHA